MNKNSIDRTAIHVFRSYFKNHRYFGGNFTILLLILSMLVTNTGVSFKTALAFR
jgi:hypothetical protein